SPAAIRPPLGLPRYMYPGLPLPSGLAPEAMADLVKNHQQVNLQAELSKQQQEAEQLGKQQQQNGAKKEELHRAPMSEHHNEAAAFHLDASMPPPGTAQRNASFSSNMRSFPPYGLPGAQPERWTSTEAALMHSMYGMQLGSA